LLLEHVLYFYLGFDHSINTKISVQYEAIFHNIRFKR